MVQKRQTAYKIRISDLLRGTYVKQEGEWEPNYVLFKDKKISRINIIANLIDKYENDDKSYGAIDLDDGSGVIRGKVWKEDIKLIENVKIGDLVLVIAKIRELNDERYLVLESVRVLRNPAWAELRKLELNKLWGEETKGIRKEKVKDTIISPRQKILSFIESVGEVNEEKILNEIGLNKEEVLKIIEDLIREGEIYRPTPGLLRMV